MTPTHSTEKQTPRTDRMTVSVVIDGPAPGDHNTITVNPADEGRGRYVEAAFARTLETELSEARAEQYALSQVRRWLSQGATIRATNQYGGILKVLPDGTIHGGVTVGGTSRPTAEQIEACARELFNRHVPYNAMDQERERDAIAAVLTRHFNPTKK